jgi:glycosyltransferase involved in cell wall biosynthesis
MFKDLFRINELESFFNNGKIFVVCSETEGFPRTILQAASCGSLIVSSSVGDIPRSFVTEKMDFWLTHTIISKNTAQL